MYTAYRFKVQLCRLYIHNVHTWLVAIASPMPAQHRSLLEQTSLRSFDTNILIYKTQFRHCLYGTGPISQHAYSQLQAASLQFLCVHALYSSILCKYSNLLTRNINIKMLLKLLSVNVLSLKFTPVKTSHYILQHLELIDYTTINIWELCSKSEFNHKVH